MDTKVQLVIVGTHQTREDTDTLETRTEASYFLKNDAHYLIYEETDGQSGEVVHSRIKYKNGILELTRKGSAETIMIFEKGRTHKTAYHTPMGAMLLEMNTKRLDFHSEGGEIRIEAEYDMRLNEDYRTLCKILIRTTKGSKKGADQ